MTQKKKEKKFEEYYLAITDKFIESLQIYIAAILDKYEDISEIGTKLLDIKSFGVFKLSVFSS